MTHQIRSGTGHQTWVRPGHQARIRVRITVRGEARIGAVYSTRITGIWAAAGDATRTDVIKARVRVVS